MSKKQNKKAKKQVLVIILKDKNDEQVKEIIPDIRERYSLSYNQTISYQGIEYR